MGAFLEGKACRDHVENRYFLREVCCDWLGNIDSEKFVLVR